MKKIIFLFIIFILLTLPINYAFAQENEGQPLEIKYPSIPGEVTPPTVVSQGLPGYVNYIYYFSFAIIGIIILGALIYSGVLYLLSTGSPEKLTFAKNGITSAFIGAIILFSSFFIFNSINPELTKLEAEDPSLIEPVITPGIYLCNYDAYSNEPTIGSIISKYTDKNATEEELIEAARDFKTKIRTGDKICFRVAFSGNISFSFNTLTNTIFVIPRKEYIKVTPTETNLEGINIEWKYDYGIIFHQKDDFHGKCALAAFYDDFIGTENEIYYYLGQTRSVTLFEKPIQEPTSDQKGVTLYQCLDYNQAGSCPPELEGGPADKTFPANTPGPDMTQIQQGSLGNLASNNAGQGNVNGTRSIQIDREGFYFAVLSSENNNRGDICEVITEDDNNLLDRPIGQCEITFDGRSCKGLLDWNEEEEYLRDCKPCTNSLTVIKGNVVK